MTTNTTHAVRTRGRRTAAGSIAALAVSALLLGGCAATPESGPDELVLVAGVRQGSPAIPTALVTQALSRLGDDGDHLAVVSSDGVPRIVFDLVLRDVPPNLGDREDYLEDLAALVGQAIDGAAATTPETDTNEAIALAGSVFSVGPGTKRIVVLDSMLTTAGAFSMLGGGLYADPTDRVAALQDGNALPDLSGITVQVPRLGVVVDPQPPLTEDARSSLESQWGAYFTAANAESVEFGGASLTATPQSAKTLPTVTPVPIERPEPVTAACRGTLPDASIGFRGDEAVFLDDGAATATIATVVSAISGCTGEIIVEGSTSSVGGQDGNVDLSTRRGRAVADRIAAALGVPAETIRVIGYGAEWPCRVPDRDGSGALVESAAAANRTVVVSRGVAPGTCA